MSSFVLSANFFRTKDRAGIVANAAKRYFRLGLPVLGSVLIALILIKLHAFQNARLSSLTGSDWLLRFWQSDQSLWATLYHGTIGVYVAGASDQFNTVLWTMRTELLGSFMLFGLLYTIGTFRYRWVIYLVLSALLIKTYFVAFIAGIALCDLYYLDVAVIRRTLERGWWIPFVAVGLYLGTSPVDSLRDTPFDQLTRLMPFGISVSTLTHLIGATLMVFALPYAASLQRALSHRTVTYIGGLSFSLYLTHLFILGTFTSALFALVEPHLGYGLGFIVTVIPTLALMWGVAHIFMKLVDVPAMQVSSIFYKRWVQPIIAKRQTT